MQTCLPDNIELFSVLTKHARSRKKKPYVVPKTTIYFTFCLLDVCACVSEEGEFALI